MSSSSGAKETKSAFSPASERVWRFGTGFWFLELLLCFAFHNRRYMHASFTTARIKENRGTGTEKFDLTLGGIRLDFGRGGIAFVSFTMIPTTFASSFGVDSLILLAVWEIGTLTFVQRFA